jgi:hypothetical protein
VKRGFLLLTLPVLFLLGFGVAAFMGGHGDTGTVVKVAEETQMPVADVAPSPHPTVEGSGTVVVDSSDCFTGGQPNPAGTTVTTNEPSEPAPSAPSGSGGSGLGTDEGTKDAPRAMPPEHPGTATDSECPRSTSGSKHP